MKHLKTFCCGLVSLLWISCGDKSPGPPEQALVKSRGNQAVVALKTKLKGELQKAMKTGGPIAAISHCQSIAPELTAASAENQPGVVVRRTSSRVRNPDNHPDSIDLKVLGIFQGAKDQGREMPVEHLEWTRDESGANQVVRYYQALFIQPLCLNCHGGKGEMQPEVIELLEKLYPNDRATGYSLGDFRGLVRVDMEW